MIKNKKAISIMVGYVLLVAFGIAMGIIVYGYLKTYTPSDTISCPTGVSIFIRSTSCGGGELNISLKNNGKFDLAGYLIKGANSSDQEVATIDLSEFLIEGGYKVGKAILMDKRNQNKFKIKEKMGSKFSGISTDLTKIEIIPVRWQKDENGKIKFVSCGDSKVSEELNC